MQRVLFRTAHRPAHRFSLWTLAWRGVVHSRRPYMAVVLSVGIASAVITGSLVIRDSVRTTLRNLAVEQLGNVRWVLTSQRFFRQETAMLIERACGKGMRVAPVILSTGCATHEESGAVASGVSIVGVTDEFWQFFPSGPAVPLDRRHAVVNRYLADDLGAGQEHALIVSLAKTTPVARRTSFGRRGMGDTVRAMRLTVSGILPAEGAGIFSLRNDRPRPRILFVSLPYLQEALHEEGRVNALLATGQATTEEVNTVLARSLSLDDMGVRTVRHANFVSFDCDSLVFPAPVADALLTAAREEKVPARPVSIYLANTLRSVSPRPDAPRRFLPYSIVAGIPSEPVSGFPPLRTPAGDPSPLPRPGEILLGRWAADRLAARPQDRVVLTVYEVNSDGSLGTRDVECTVSGILGHDTVSVDSGFVPAIEHITDAATMADWDPPFPVDLSLIAPDDEAYWRAWGAAPKAFISLETAVDLWGRWAGSGITSIQMPKRDGSGAPLSDRALKRIENRAVRLAAEPSGYLFQDARQKALASAEGTTDFGLLFLALGSFLIFSALFLIMLLFALTVDRRAHEFGILLSTGFTGREVEGVVMREAVLLAAAGSLPGAALGVGYAAVILKGLRTFWADAAAGWPLSIHLSLLTLFAGCAAALAVSLASVFLVASRLRRFSAVQLLAGWRALAGRPRRAARAAGFAIAVVTAAGGACACVFGNAPVVGRFIVAGILFLLSFLSLFSALLQHPAGAASAARFSCATLAWRGASRNWLRTLLTAGLIASGTFLLVTVSAHRREPGAGALSGWTSGTGGFALVAWSDIPLSCDIGTAAGRAQIGLSDEESRALERCAIYSFPASDGDDISCLNLRRTDAPRAIGITQRFVRERGGFSFVSVDRALCADAASPWSIILNARTAFLDAATATWNLRVRMGDIVRLGHRQFAVAGLLRESVFAGAVLIGEEQFRDVFGPDAGYRFFLIDAAPEDIQAVTSLLAERFGTLGFRMTPAREVLASYRRLENTYIAAFETLGGFGFLLGTLGLAAVILRSIFERRQELALLLAVGLQARQATGILISETVFIVLAGMTAGIASALIASLPALLSLERTVNWMRVAAVLLACALAGAGAAAACARSVTRQITPASLRTE